MLCPTFLDGETAPTLFCPETGSPSTSRGFLSDHMCPVCVARFRFALLYQPVKQPLQRLIVGGMPSSSVTMAASSPNLNFLSLHFLSHMCLTPRGSPTVDGTKPSSSKLLSFLHVLARHVVLCLHKFLSYRCFPLVSAGNLHQS